MHPYLNIAIRAAREAGKVISRSLDRMGSLDIQQKGHNDFVTNVDKAAEAAIMEVISNAYNDHSFLGEESGEVVRRNTDKVWIIDPLDGTTNFIHGYPNYVVSIAYQYKGVIEHGVIYHPLTGDLYTASRGEGAQLNGKRIRVSKRANLEGALISTGTPRIKAYLPAYLHSIEALHSTIAATRRCGATALDLAYVASGALDAFWHVDSKPWDLAAGVLMIKEAGGLVTDLDGSENYMHSGNLIAGNPKVLKALLTTLRPHLPTEAASA